ncbi:MAG: VOC family protein [Acutalibacteraceae bacterium]|nr:VOC family protein [Acutalibacteraceae bacterium]
MAPVIKGVHHICLKACNLEDFNKMVKFYTEILGLPVALKWGEGETTGMMLDTGDAWLEIFANGTDYPTSSAIRHIALRVEDTDACIEAVRAAGYKITVEPKDHTFPTEPLYNCRLGFCRGPVGEEVEFFQVK